MEFSTEFKIMEGMVNFALWLPVNPRNEVLLQRKDSKHLRWPNYWGFFGGIIEKGEKGLDTLSRESEEELGKKIKLLMKPKFLGSQIFEEGHGKFHRTVNVNYFGIRFDGNLKNIMLNEGAGFSVFDFETVRKYGELGLIVPPNYKAIERFYKNLKEGVLNFK